MSDKENPNAQVNFKVVKASKKQVDLVFDQFYKYEEKRNNAIVFAAVNEDNEDKKDENIIGYLVVEEKTVPPPLYGTDWFVWNIFTLPEYRREGVAAALLKETIKYAEQANIQHLLGSCTNTPAHMFWLKHKFCFIIYGQKIDDVNRPQEHDNYSHMIFYRVNKTEKENYIKQENYKIIKAEKEHLNWIFDEHILNDGLKFFHDKRDDIFGLAAVDKENNVMGIITSYAYELGSPLEGVQWMIPYIYVRPELRRQGIGGTLIKETIKIAQKENVTQLTCLFLDEEAIKFWSDNNFDMCNYYIMSGKDGKCPVSAALRVL